MDNCNLDKLGVSRGKLQPAFSSQVTEYEVTVESSVVKVNLDIVTSDSGASYNVLFGQGSSSIKLSDGLNRVEVEVVAENGAVKKYCVSITKLSASASQLGDLTLEGDVELQPTFTSTGYEYSCIVPFHWSCVTLLPKVLDKKMKVSVNGGEVSQPVPVNIGDTMVQVSVTSADGSNSKVYEVLVTRDLIPLPVTFSDAKQQLDFECPVSLSAFYRPVSIRHSDPKHVFSGPYLEMLARRSKVDPLNDAPLGTDWKVDEPELDGEMSGAAVKCFFAYRGCDSVMKLCELGSHTLACTHRPTGDLELKDVTETGWYKRLFAASASFEIETKHTLEVRKWEKKLQLAAGEDNVESLCDQAQNHLNLYRQYLLKSGGSIRQSKDREAAVESLSLAAGHFASAIALSPKDARLHFLLGLVLEEQHYATDVFSLQKKVEKQKETLSEAKSAARQDEVLAVCLLHGFQGTPSVEKQMQALDKEYQQLKEQGQSSRADYVQTLFLWLAEKTGKAGSSAMQDEEKQGFLQQALMKYLDAWSLSPKSWEFNLQVGRLMLLLKIHGSSRQALQHLQSGLAQQPQSPALRFFTGLALLQQESKASEDTEKEAALFLQQGLEHFVNQRCSKRWEEQDASEPLSSINTHFLRGLLSLGELQQRNVLSEKAISAQHVYHTVAVLAAQTVSRCVGQGGKVSGQLEWPLLDAHLALLQRLIQQGQGQTKETQPLVARRCQALSALVRLSCIAACQELLDLQERVCQLAVVSTPRDSSALALLGLAQLAQYGNNPNAEKSEEAIRNACLSFHASMELEEQSQRGAAPPQLSEQKWWQDRQKAEAEKAEKQAKGGKGPSDAGAATAGASRGRGGARGGRGGPGPSRPPAPPPRAPAATPSASTRGGKAAQPAAKAPAARGKPGAAAAAAAAAAPGPAAAKPKLPADKSKQASCPDTAETAEVPPAEDPSAEPAPMNRRSHVPRLGLARALSLSTETQDRAVQLYSEVISMAPEFHDAYIELVQLLEVSDRRAAVEVYCRFPLKPADEQSYDDAFITGEIVRLLMVLEEFDHPQLSPNLIAYGKIMGLSTIEKYIDILDSKSKSAMLRSVYAKINDRDEKDPELQDFFRYKCWI